MRENEKRGAIQNYGSPQENAVEKRYSVRRPLLGDLSGRLIYEATSRQIPCLAVDVSKGGLRILAREQLVPKTTLTLNFENQQVALVVVWCKPECNTTMSFACGLSAIDASCDLIKFFTIVGWLHDSFETKEWLRLVEFVDRSTQQ